MKNRKPVAGLRSKVHHRSEVTIVEHGLRERAIGEILPASFKVVFVCELALLVNSGSGRAPNSDSKYTLTFTP